MNSTGYSLKQTIPIFFLLLTAFYLHAQEASVSKVYDYIRVHQAEWQLTSQDVNDLRVAQVVHTKHNGVTHYYLNQQINGVDVDKARISVHVTPGGKVFNVGDRLVSDLSAKIRAKAPAITVESGLQLAAAELGIRSRTVPALLERSDAYRYRFEPGAISSTAIEGQLKYIQDKSGQYQLAWVYILQGKEDLWELQIDAASGDLLAKKRMTLHCQFEDGYLSHPRGAHTESCLHETSRLRSTTQPLTSEMLVADGAQYNVFPMPYESPSHGERSMVVNPAHPEASPFGWHDTDGIEGPEYTITRGNNVFAYVDRNWDGGPDEGITVDGGDALLFDFDLDFSREPVDYQEAAVTNLFYWNNIMHDLADRYGFDEGSGNFQEKNYGVDGVDTDYVFAMAQRGADDPQQCGAETNNDVPCINNANFSTPPDGSNPAMRMFLWTSQSGNKYLRVDEPAALAGLIETGLALEFGQSITEEPVTGEVVIADDGTGQGTLGCNSSAIDLTGKIALIDRGSCDFSQKILNAQNAGAIGAIICNFQDAIINMGAGLGAPNVTIPSVFISSSDCARIRDAVGNGLVVSLVAPPTVEGPERVDGDFDNGVIAHEYTHGISNRLTGGSFSAGCLSNAEARGMGEGWSDFVALIATVRTGDNGSLPRGIGTYAQREGPTGRGIRPFPYSTDMAINPHTYEDIAFESVPHGVGSVWCAMLWDLYWALTDKYGFDEDIFDGDGGNIMAVQLIVDAMKYQPCDPGFTDARDAILIADQVNHDGANQALIWEVFARRGLGWGADQGDPDQVNDGKLSFEICPACTEALSVRKEMTDFINAGDPVDVTLKVGNYKPSSVTEVEVRDVIPEGTSVIMGSASMPFEMEGNEIVFAVGSMESMEELDITYTLQTSGEVFSESLFLDDMEEGDLRWDIFFDETGGLQIWEVVDVFANSGENAWFVQNTAEESDHWIQFRDPILIEEGQPVLRFYHNYDTEPRADAGFISISTDGGNSWKILDEEFIRNGYPGRIQYTTFAIPNLNAFWGSSGDDFIASYVDLSDFIGEEVNIRWRFGSDDNTDAFGWFVDDVEIMDLKNYNSEVCVTSAEGDQSCANAPFKGTIIETGESSTVSVEELTDDEAILDVFPNPAKERLNITIASKIQGDAQLSISSVTGERLWDQPIFLTKGTENLQLDVRGFAPGMYFTRLTAGNKQRIIRFVVQ